MDKPKKYFTLGLWTFAFLTVSLLFTMYAAGAGSTYMMYAGFIVSSILGSNFLVTLLQAKKTIETLEEELHSIKERENAKMQKQQTGGDNQQYTEVFRIDEYHSRIMNVNETDLEVYTEKILQNFANELKIVQGLVFVHNSTDNLFHVSGQYAYFSETQPRSFAIGEGLSGQVAKNRQTLNLKEIPEGYVTALSGLGKGTPRNVIIAPIVHNDNCIGIIELATFKAFGENEEALVGKICESMANRLNELRS